MEISSDKSKILVNSTNPRSSTNIRMNGKVLEVDQFKYLRFALDGKGWHIIKGSKDQTGTGTPNHHQANISLLW